MSTRTRHHPRIHLPFQLCGCILVGIVDQREYLAKFPAAFDAVKSGGTLCGLGLSLLSLCGIFLLCVGLCALGVEESRRQAGQASEPALPLPGRQPRTPLP